MEKDIEENLSSTEFEDDFEEGIDEFENKINLRLIIRIISITVIIGCSVAILWSASKRTGLSHFNNESLEEYYSSEDESVNSVISNKVPEDINDVVDDFDVISKESDNGTKPPSPTNHRGNLTESDESDNESNQNIKFIEPNIRSTSKLQTITPVSIIKKHEIEEFMIEESENEETETIEEIEEPKKFDKCSGTLMYLTKYSKNSIKYTNMIPKKLTEYGKFAEEKDKVNCFSISNDLKKFAFAVVSDKIGRIKVKNFDEESIEQVSGDHCYDPNISPDGKMVIYRKMGWKTLFFFDLDSKIETKLDLPPISIKYDPKFFPDSKRFAFIAYTKKVFKIIVSDIANPQKHKCIYKSVHRPIDLAVSPNGRYIAFSMDDLIHVVPVNDKERLKKDFKFGMPLPTVSDKTMKHYCVAKKCQIDTRIIFKKPLWTADGSGLIFYRYSDELRLLGHQNNELFCTGYGKDKYELIENWLYVSNGDIFFRHFHSEPVLKVKDNVKTVIDAMITKIETDNYKQVATALLDEVLLNISGKIQEIESQKTVDGNNAIQGTTENNIHDSAGDERDSNRNSLSIVDDIISDIPDIQIRRIAKEYADFIAHESIVNALNKVKSTIIDNNKRKDPELLV